jgi:hypothetical protein
LQIRQNSQEVAYLRAEWARSCHTAVPRKYLTDCCHRLAANPATQRFAVIRCPLASASIFESRSRASSERRGQTAKYPILHGF